MPEVRDEVLSGEYAALTERQNHPAHKQKILRQKHTAAIITLLSVCFFYGDGGRRLLLQNLLQLLPVALNHLLIPVKALFWNPFKIMVLVHIDEAVPLSKSFPGGV